MLHDNAARVAPFVANQSRTVGLIIPPSAFLLDERVFVSLGILRIASVLEQHRHVVNLLDLSGVKNYIETLESFLQSSKVEAIGITATTPQLPSVFAIARTIRRLRPDIRLILGGPHVTLTFAAVKLERELGKSDHGRATKAAAQLEKMFDVVCSGDGEKAVLLAVQPDSPNYIDGDDNRGPYFMSNEVYEQMPQPARHLVDLDSYHYSIEGFRATSLIGQLGCPFNCGFCGGRNSKSLRVIRTRSIESIVNEMEFLHKTYGYTGFMFYDDELNVGKTMVGLMNAICDLQERLGVEFRLRGFVKSELLTEEQAETMYRAGFRWLLCGFEAANPRILKNIRKRATLDDNNRAVEFAKKHNLKVKALMSVGHPGETEESVLDIHDWLVRAGVDDFDCTVITTYPGTPYYDYAVPHESQKGVWTYAQPETGDRLHAYEIDYTDTPNYYKGDPDGGYKAFVFTDYLSSEQLVELRDHVERETRAKLNVPFNPGRAAILYEHSMGQGIPANILRCSNFSPE